MAEVMIASEMTESQVESLVAKFRDAVRKHCKEITKDAAQAALGVDNIGMEMFEPFRRHTENFSETIVRRVQVNRTRTPQKAIDATGRKQYVDSIVAASMPCGEDEEVELCLFPLKKFTGVDDVQKAIADHGLTPDPQALAALNEADPAFADSHPNGTQWVNAEGKHCFLAFGHWGGGRDVRCGRGEGDWRGYWWLGGVRKYLK